MSLDRDGGFWTEMQNDLKDVGDPLFYAGDGADLEGQMSTCTEPEAPHSLFIYQRGHTYSPPSSSYCLYFRKHPRISHIKILVKNYQQAWDVPKRPFLVFMETAFQGEFIVCPGWWLEENRGE